MNLYDNPPEGLYRYGEELLDRSQLITRIHDLARRRVLEALQCEKHLGDTPENLAAEAASEIVLSCLKENIRDIKANALFLIGIAPRKIFRQKSRSFCSLEDDSAELPDSETIGLVRQRLENISNVDCCVLSILRSTQAKWFLLYMAYVDDKRSKPYDVLCAKWPEVKRGTWRQRIHRTQELAQKHLKNADCLHCPIKLISTKVGAKNV